MPNSLFRTLFCTHSSIKCVILIISVHKTHRDGHVHVVHQQPETCAGDHQGSGRVQARFREVSGRDGQGPQGEAVPGQSAHQTSAKVPELQAANSEANQAHRYVLFDQTVVFGIY